MQSRVNVRVQFPGTDRFIPMSFMDAADFALWCSERGPRGVTTVYQGDASLTIEGGKITVRRAQ